MLQLHCDSEFLYFSSVLVSQSKRACNILRKIFAQIEIKDHVCQQRFSRISFKLKAFLNNIENTGESKITQAAELSEFARKEV